MQLKNQFPELMKERNMQPPPKNAFQLGNQKELLDKRREELEKWMWRLISKPEVARSTVLKAFLDFEKALQRAQQQRWALQLVVSTAALWHAVVYFCCNVECRELSAPF